VYLSECDWLIAPARGSISGLNRAMKATAVLDVTDDWRKAFPGAVVGALIMRGVCNPAHSDELDARKRKLEGKLRDTGAPSGHAELDRLLRPYVDYYRARGKTYHVKAQRESVATKGKPFPSRAALVEAMFMAEVKNLVLTAGHDLGAVVPPLRADVSRNPDRYVVINGTEQGAAVGDMVMVDGEGIVSTMLYGPDRRTRITPDTTDVCFAVYAPAGVGEPAVRSHLADVRANVLLVAPSAETEHLVTVPA
jgi:DNA/RNA-binding domain of Phe-tRNA-synthetase-like protein